MECNAHDVLFVVVLACLQAQSPSGTAVPEDPMDVEQAPPESASDPFDPLDANRAPDGGMRRFLIVPMPLLSYNSDEGLGGGFVVSLHHRVPPVEALKNELSLRLFATTAGVQRHEAKWEGRDPLSLPLRTSLKLGFFSTTTQTFCGVGMGVTCDEAIAREAAEDRGLHEGSKAYDAFVRRYYEMRYVKPYFDGLMRWRLRDPDDGSPRMELFHGWRLAWFMPGTLFDHTPYPGSLYARIYPKGEPGISSVPLVGVAFDTRDFEPAPSSGWFLETSLRGSHPWVGSAWQWVGANASVEDFQTLTDNPHVVWAGRLIVDAIDGDAPIEEVAQVGGMKSTAAFGGQWIGRGVRDRRYLGKLKAIHQSELRTDLGSASFFGIRFDLQWLAFGDVGWIAWDVDDITGARTPTGAAAPWRAGSPLGLVWGAGVGFRAVLNRATVAQVEGAGSLQEQRFPALYTPVGNAW